VLPSVFPVVDELVEPVADVRVLVLELMLVSVVLSVVVLLPSLAAGSSPVGVRLVGGPPEKLSDEDVASPPLVLVVAAVALI